MAGAVASIIIIAFGLVLLLDNLGIIHGRDIWDYLPCVLIALGILRVVEAKGRPGGSIVGGVMAGAGTLWLLDNLGIIRFNAGLIWPLILISGGVTMLARVLDRRDPVNLASPAPGGDFESTVSMYSIFGGSKRVVRTEDFRGGDIVSIFGGNTLDLRNAKIASGPALVDITAIFGGVDLKVPSEWIVVNKGIGVFGGYEDKSNHPVSGPQLVITGSAVFGGVTIKN